MRGVVITMSVAVSAAIAGCASPSAPPPPAPAPGPVDAAQPAPTPPAVGGGTGFDGRYKPTSWTGMPKVGGHMKCISAGGNLRVRNGIATMSWRGTMQGKVGPDGSLDMQTSASHLIGQFANSAFNGKLETPVCIWTITLTRS